MNNRYIYKAFCTAMVLLTALLGNNAHAQVLDKVAAVVGKNRIILQSEVDAQVASTMQNTPDADEAAVRCEIMEQMILQKMLVEQAERDSVVVSEEDVEAALDNRVRYFVGMLGSKEKLEEVSGKTIFQLKESYRDMTRENMMAERVQGQLLQSVKITPAEVRAFFNTIPVDSLPYFPAMVEMGQIVINPPTNPELDMYARTKLEGIRKDIVENGKSFETMASMNSDDPGSRDNGGRYDGVSRKGGGWAPEFVAAAFKLQNGEVSPIVKTQFGYHIIQMVKRRGDEADVRHILIKQEHTSADYKAAFLKLDTIRSQLIAGKYSFQEAVGKYSQDEMSTRTGGMILDAQTNSSLMEIEKLDPAIALMIDTMKVGSYSQPQVFDNGRGDKSCRIVYMKNITKPHKANLVDDYARIQDIALQQKKSKKLLDWVAEKSPTYYVKIAPEFATCKQLDNYVKNSK